MQVRNRHDQVAVNNGRGVANPQIEFPAVLLPTVGRETKKSPPQPPSSDNPVQIKTSRNFGRKTAAPQPPTIMLTSHAVCTESFALISGCEGRVRLTRRPSERGSKWSGGWQHRRPCAGTDRARYLPSPLQSLRVCHVSRYTVENRGLDEAQCTCAITAERSHATFTRRTYGPRATDRL